MNSESRIVTVFAVAVCLSVAACADLSRGPASPAVDAGSDFRGEGGSDDGAVITFASVHPLVLASCQRCHAAGAEAGDTQLLLTGEAAADYASVSRFVDVSVDISTPAGSRLLSKTSGSGHGGGTVFAVGSPEYQTIRQWIQQGARP